MNTNVVTMWPRFLETWMNHLAQRDDDRIRVHPAILQIIGALAIALGGILAGYYKGAIDQLKESNQLSNRLTIIETHYTDAERDRASIILKLDELSRAVKDLSDERIAEHARVANGGVAKPHYSLIEPQGVR